jgi:predicted dehydrogenase
LVDDEAIIVLSYDSAVAVIGASWNWPIGRKDMEIYGRKGVVYADNRHNLRLRIAEGYDGFTETKQQLPELKAPFHDPFAYLIAVVRGQLVPHSYDLSALPNNIRVMEILDAAKRSAKKGRVVRLSASGK